MHKPTKKTIVASALTVGATGALLFGGQAVSTAFTSTSDGHYIQGQGAKVGVVVENGEITASNLVPGAAPQDGGTVKLTNASSVSGVMTIKFGKFTVNSNGTDGVPRARSLVIHLEGLGDVSAADLAGQSFRLDNVPAGQAFTAHVQEYLKAGTGNEWNGADAYLPYSVTMTAGR